MTRITTVADFVDQIADKVLIPGALDKPQYKMLSRGMTALRVLEWGYQHRGALLLSASVAGLLDYRTIRILPWLINTTASLTSEYGLPMMYVLGAGYGAYQLGYSYWQSLMNIVGGSAGFYRPGQSLEQQQRRLLLRASTQLNQLVDAGDGTAQAVAALLASTFSPEATELWPGWVSWVISLLGGSNPMDSISDTGTRLLLDKVERDITEKGVTIKTMIETLLVFKKYGDDIGYHTSAAISLFGTRLQKLIAQIASQLLMVNNCIKALYVLLDTYEEKLLLKPGTLSKLIDPVIQQLYHHIYFRGHSFGRAPSEGRERVYHATPPFTKVRIAAARARLAAGPEDERVIYITEGRTRFRRSDEQLWHYVLDILGADSVSYLKMSFETFKSETSAFKMVRLAAVLTGVAESVYLYKYRNGEVSFADFYRMVQVELAKVNTVDVTPCHMLDFSLGHTTSLEKYLMDNQVSRTKQLRGLPLGEVQSYVLQSAFDDTHSYQRYREHFIALFGKDGPLIRRNGISQMARVNLAILQNQAISLFDNHGLSMHDKQLLLALLVQQYFPLDKLADFGMSRYADRIGACYSAVIDPSITGDHTAQAIMHHVSDNSLTIAQHARLSLRASRSVTVYNFIHKQISTKHGILGDNLLAKKQAYKLDKPNRRGEGAKTRRIVKDIINTLHDRLYRITFSSMMCEADKQKEMIKELLSTQRKLSNHPYMQCLLEVAIVQFFDAEQVRYAEEQLTVIRLRQKCLMRRVLQQIIDSGHAETAAEHAEPVAHALPVAVEREALMSDSGSDDDDAYTSRPLEITLSQQSVRSLTECLSVIRNFPGIDTLDRLFSTTIRHYGATSGMRVSDRDEINRILRRAEHYDRTDLSGHPIWSLLALVAKQHTYRWPDTSRLMQCLSRACLELTIDLSRSGVATSAIEPPPTGPAQPPAALI